MPYLDQLTAKNKESKDTSKRCSALQDGANPINPTIFSTLPQAIAICYMVVVFGLEAVVRLCKCERVIPHSLIRMHKWGMFWRGVLAYPRREYSSYSSLYTANRTFGMPWAGMKVICAYWNLLAMCMH